MELARKAGLAGCEPGPSPALSPGLGLQEQATLPGFSTWLLVIKARYTTEPFPQYLSACLFFFFLEISNPFVYLKLTWWYRKSPDSLSPQWAWKFLYLTPCFTICWKRWNNTKAILLPRSVVYVGIDVLYSMTSSLQYDIIPGYAFNALKLSYVPPVTPIHGIYYLYILQLQFSSIYKILPLIGSIYDALFFL